ncbi:MAG: DPP IV N-terminal domain-containing protein, partial [Bryobacteraceae bacterium]
MQPHVRLAVIDVATGEVKWADAGQKDRVVEFSQPLWSEDGSRAVLAVRAADNKDRWILALDPVTGKTHALADAHDDAWVDGPGINTLGWMKDDRSVYFQSERDGYSHLYTISFDGGEPRQLTSGEWEVTNVELSRDKTRFYLTTSEGSPFERQVYVVSAESGGRTRLTSMPGAHQVTLSPDETWLADVYSYTNKPPELYVGENRQHTNESRLT